MRTNGCRLSPGNREPLYRTRWMRQGGPRDVRTDGTSIQVWVLTSQQLCGLINNGQVTMCTWVNGRRTVTGRLPRHSFCESCPPLSDSRRRGLTTAHALGWTTARRHCQSGRGRCPATVAAPGRALIGWRPWPAPIPALQAC